MNKSEQFVSNLKEARDSLRLFTLKRLREEAKDKSDRELLEETWTNIQLITEVVNGALCRIEEEDRAIVVNEKIKESIERVFSGEGPSTFLVTLSGENRSGKSLIEAVSEVSVKHKGLNRETVLFYSYMDEKTLFSRLMKGMFDSDLFMINLETGQTVSCLEDYAFLAESKGVRVVKDSEEDAPGEEED